jgi:hypothetical protein
VARRSQVDNPSGYGDAVPLQLDPADDAVEPHDERPTNPGRRTLIVGGLTVAAAGAVLLRGRSSTGSDALPPTSAPSSSTVATGQPNAAEKKSDRSMTSALSGTLVAWVGDRVIARPVGLVERLTRRDWLDVDRPLFDAVPFTPQALLVALGDRAVVAVRRVDVSDVPDADASDLLLGTTGQLVVAATDGRWVTQLNDVGNVVELVGSPNPDNEFVWVRRIDQDAMMVERIGRSGDVSARAELAGAFVGATEFFLVTEEAGNLAGHVVVGESVRTIDIGDGRGLATSNDHVLWSRPDGGFVVTELRTGLTSTPIESDRARVAALMPDASVAAVADANEIIVWRPNGDSVMRFPSRTELHLAFIDATHLLLIDELATVSVLDIESERRQDVGRFDALPRAIAVVAGTPRPTDEDRLFDEALAVFDAPLAVTDDRALTFRWVSQFDTRIGGLSFALPSDASPVVTSSFQQGDSLYVTVPQGGGVTARLLLPEVNAPIVIDNANIDEFFRVSLPGSYTPTGDGRALARFDGSRLSRYSLSGRLVSTTFVGAAETWQWRDGRVEVRTAAGRAAIDVVSYVVSDGGSDGGSDGVSERRPLDARIVFDVRGTHALVDTGDADRPAIGIVDLETLLAQPLSEIRGPYRGASLSPDGAAAVLMSDDLLQIGSTDQSRNVALDVSEFNPVRSGNVLWLNDRFVLFYNGADEPTVLDSMTGQRRVIGSALLPDRPAPNVAVLDRLPPVLRQQAEQRRVGPTPPSQGPSATPAP